MKKLLVTQCLAGSARLPARAVDAGKELDAAAQVIQSMSSSKQIPSSVLEQSKCIAVVPGLTKGGFFVGGEHGHGENASFQSILGGQAHPPNSAQRFLAALLKMK